MSDGEEIGVLGATSLVGACLLPLLREGGYRVTAFSRSCHDLREEDGIWWRPLPGAASSPMGKGGLAKIISLAPIWVLPDYFPWFAESGVRRLVVLSSTSRFTKVDSADPAERALAQQLADAEELVQEWAEAHGVEWVILRPTLIYGLGRDKNISEIARFIRRFSFFPLAGPASGLRQPIHARDVAQACLAVLAADCGAGQEYNIAGAETLTYREMVTRVFASLDRRPRLLSVPLPLISTAITLLRILPRCRHWSGGMAARMNKDMVFDCSAAARDLDFRPRSFSLAAVDIPL